MSSVRLITSLFLFLFLSYSAAESVKDDNDTSGIMVSAAQRGFVEEIDSMISAGVNINIRDVNGNSALSAASENGRDALVKFLLSKGADKSDIRPLHHNPLTVPDIKDDYEAPKIFIYCVKHGLLKGVNSMLARGVDVNSYDSQMNNSVAVSAIYGHPALTQLLIKKGGNVNLINGLGQSPAAAAIDNGGAPGAEIIIRSGGRLQALEKEWYREKMYSILSGKDKNFEERDQISEKTLLMMAAEKNHTGTVMYLAAKGANINSEFNSSRREHRPYNGSTALIFALRDGTGIDAAYELIRLKASLDNINNTDETALICAVHQANRELVLALLNAGANVNRADSFGKTPYYHAMMNSNDELMAILKARGGR